jgi:hypothetical protein
MINTTRKEAVTLIEESINNIIPLQDERLEKVIFAVNNDLQVRDWVMGMPARFTLDESIEFVRYMAVHTTAEDSVPFITVNALFEYERGNLDSAVKMVEYALAVDEHYSLAQLVDRMLDKVPAESLPIMREELDPKVVAACMEEFVITEEEEK